METIDMGNSCSVVNTYVAELRDVNVQTDRMRFRRNLERIGEAQAYELSRMLNYSEKKVQTPLGVAAANTFDDQVVVATVFRAGLPMHQGFLNVFDKAENAFVSAYRYYKDKECRQVDVHIEYIAAPDLTGKTLMLVDPMLATGGSASAAIRFIKQRGCHNIRLVNLIAAPEGVARIQKDHPDVNIYVAAMDEKLNEHGYIVPGLGDAGDRLFGTK